MALSLSSGDKFEVANGLHVEILSATQKVVNMQVSGTADDIQKHADTDPNMFSEGETYEVFGGEVTVVFAGEEIIKIETTLPRDRVEWLFYQGGDYRRL